MQRQISGSSDTLAETPLGPVLAKAGLGVQLGPFRLHPDPAEGFASCESPKQVAYGHLYAAFDIGMKQSLCRST